MTEFARQFAEQHRPPPVDHTKAKPARYSRQNRSEQAKDRANRDAEYNVTSDIFKEQNPECFYCGKQYEPEAPEGLQTDHIVSGTAGRAISLLNSEGWNNACPECNQIHFPAYLKTAKKLEHIIRTIVSYRGKQFEKSEDSYIIKRVKRALTRTTDPT